MYEIKVRRDVEGIHVATLWEVTSGPGGTTLRRFVRERLSPDRDLAVELAAGGLVGVTAEDVLPAAEETLPAPGTASRAELLTRAAAAVEEALSGLDLSKTACPCCGSLRYSNYEDKKTGDRLEAFARGLRDIARASS